MATATTQFTTTGQAATTTFTTPPGLDLAVVSPVDGAELVAYSGLPLELEATYADLSGNETATLQIDGAAPVDVTGNLNAGTLELLTFAPALDVVGPHTVTVGITNGTLVESITVSFVVVQSPAPVANSETITVDMGETVTIDVLANDANVLTAHSPTLTIETSPTNGTATIQGTTMQTIDYTPAAGFFGSDQFEYKVTNPDGGESAPTPVNVMVLDTEAPTVAFDAPAAGQEFPLGTTSVVLSGTAADNDSVDTVEYRVNGGAFVLADGAETWTATLTGLADGTSHTVDVRSTDPAGNVSPIISRPFSIAADTNSPTVTITDPTSELPAGTTSYVAAGTATDNGTVSLVEYRIDGGPFVAATGTANWTAQLTGLTPGASINFEVRATDESNNVSSLAQRTITVNEAPVANADLATTGQDQTVNIDVLSNDTNIDPAATITITQQGVNGTATVVS